MKNSNPLKYFNDQADARKKAITEGNKKLVKAQVGYTTSQGPVDPDTAKKINEIQERPFGFDSDKNIDKIKKIVDVSRNPSNSEIISKGNIDYVSPINITGSQRSSYFYNKKVGGSVKSKKKK